MAPPGRDLLMRTVSQMIPPMDTSMWDRRTLVRHEANAKPSLRKENRLKTKLPTHPILFLGILIGLLFFPANSELWAQRQDAVRVRVFTPFSIRHLFFRPVMEGFWEMKIASNGHSIRLSPDDRISFSVVPAGMQVSRRRGEQISSLSSSCREVRLNPLAQGNDRLFRLSVPGKIDRKFRGSVWIRRQGEEIEAVWEVDVEELVASTLAAEMSTVDHREALKAQAVVARSFLASHPSRHRQQGYDFCDTTHCQFTRGVEIADRFRQAMEATRGLILLYRGKPVPAYYSTVCQGQIFTVPADEGEYPRKKTVCPWCTYHRKIAVDEQPIANPHSGARNGHHLGLCQAGCVEMARQGADYRQILSHFFPDTLLESR
jgi:hypothetical protein